MGNLRGRIEQCALPGRHPARWQSVIRAISGDMIVSNNMDAIPGWTESSKEIKQSRPSLLEGPWGG